jgi:hypothetical protein
MKKPILVTKNEKEILVDTKALKQAETPAEKADAALKLSEAIKKDKYAQLILAREDIREEIEYLENVIHEQGGYFFDSDEITEARAELADLKEELNKIQTELAIMKGERPQTVSRLKEWAVYSLIAAVGLGVALQLAGYDVTGTLMSGAGTIGNKISSGLGTAWSYISSFRSNTSESQPSTPSVPSSGALSTTTKPNIVTIGSSMIGAALTAEQLLSRLNTLQTGAQFLRARFDEANSYIFEAEANPESVNPTLLQKKKEEAALLQQELIETEENIAQLEQLQSLKNKAK